MYSREEGIPTMVGSYIPSMVHPLIHPVRYTRSYTQYGTPAHGPHYAPPAHGPHYAPPAHGPQCIPASLTSVCTTPASWTSDGNNTPEESDKGGLTLV